MVAIARSDAVPVAPGPPKSGTRAGVGFHERAWGCYLATVCSIALVFGGGVPGQGGAIVAFVGLHVLVGFALTGLVFATPGARARAIARGVFSSVGLPAVFSSMAWVLPAIHPEPYEYRWIAFDRALFGFDPSVVLGDHLAPVVVEVLQLSYASFYAIPIVAVLASARASGRAAFDRSLDLVVLGFLLSYLGYLLWPTLPPYHFLSHDVPIRGVMWAGDIHAALDAAELHRWNCFPSGHTMLSVLSLTLVWRHARSAFWLLAPVVTLLVISTVALHYHYVADVLAGLIGVPLTHLLGAQLRRA